MLQWRGVEQIIDKYNNDKATQKGRAQAIAW